MNTNQSIKSETFYQNTIDGDSIRNTGEIIADKYTFIFRESEYDDLYATVLSEMRYR